MAAVAAACSFKPWSMPGGPFVCLLAQKGVENACSGIWAAFSLDRGVFSGQRALTIERSLMSRCGQGHEPQRMYQ